MWSLNKFYNIGSKDKALYKACGESLGDGKDCNKKVVEQGDGTYRWVDWPRHRQGESHLSLQVWEVHEDEGRVQVEDHAAAQHGRLLRQQLGLVFPGDIRDGKIINILSHYFHQLTFYLSLFSCFYMYQLTHHICIKCKKNLLSWRRAQKRFSASPLKSSARPSRATRRDTTASSPPPPSGRTTSGWGPRPTHTMTRLEWNTL